MAIRTLRACRCSYLLEINLMLCIRSLKKPMFFMPDWGTRYEYINGLFSEAVS